ncbi:MAG: toprim domain-containing protein [Flavobacteriales bacterium]|nr:toprim domain-containing protein [Flavobacteriales bacterium]
MKSRSLHGIAFAKKASWRGTCLLVEGYTDVISLHQAGIANVVASSGTSLTVEQVRLIKRYSTSVTILYDGDPRYQGIAAWHRSDPGRGAQCESGALPRRRGPRQLRSQAPQQRSAGLHRERGQGLHCLQGRHAGAKPKAISEESRSDPQIVASIALVPDHVLRSLYLQQCSRLLGVQEQALISEMNKVLRQQYRKKVGGEEVPPEVLKSGTWTCCWPTSRKRSRPPMKWIARS